MEQNQTQIFGSYTAWKAQDDTWFIQFMGGSQMMYLLEGTQKAMLIDTGWGAGNLRPFVETLTQKPVMIVNTHYHPDHAGSNGEWEEAWMAPGWETDAPCMADSPFDLSLLPHPAYARHILTDGQSIELGGRSVTVKLCKNAHCNSSVFLLDSAHGLMFVGDELESAQVLLYNNGSTVPHDAWDLRERLCNARENYQWVKENEAQYTLLLPSHNGAPIAKRYAEDFIQLIDHIFAGDAVIEDDLHHFYISQAPVGKELCRVRFAQASFFIKKEQLKAVYGV